MLPKSKSSSLISAFRLPHKALSEERCLKYLFCVVILTQILVRFHAAVFQKVFTYGGEVVGQNWLWEFFTC